MDGPIAHRKVIHSLASQAIQPNSTYYRHYTQHNGQKCNTFKYYYQTTMLSWEGFDLKFEIFNIH